MTIETWEQRILAAERMILLEVGEQCRWNQLRMGAALGVHRNTVSRKLAEHAIDPRAYWQAMHRRARRLNLHITKYQRRAAECPCP